MENNYNTSATKIKVIGVGGGGCNAVNRMIRPVTACYGKS